MMISTPKISLQLLVIILTLLVITIELKAELISQSTAKEWMTAYQNKASHYQPRTEHLNKDGSAKYINRLILEQSPYLIQHAHNPVNWYAWGDDAFAQARQQNKPIFLSIGYSTCHWCHVMERESFDNPWIAEYLNQHFIAIKVDRERRPDVDKVYMTALMLIKGRGGWPMSSVLTPDGKPFFSATYLPPKMFMQVLQQSQKLWQEEEKKLRQIAEKITIAIKNRQQRVQQAEHLGQERVQLTVLSLLYQLDELQGGFSSAPKFPHESYLFLLLDTVIREQNTEVLSALELTMSLMAQGGIYDQIGGGFHRYSTDNQWLVPHFEKMLYNQANLSQTYLQLWMLTNKPAYQKVVKETLDYVLRDMYKGSGGFFSASDADSEGVEGQYFFWTQQQIKDVLNSHLSTQDSQLALTLYGVTEQGNMDDTKKVGQNILHLPNSIETYAKDHQLNVSTLYQKIATIRQLLHQERQHRIAPILDHKVITAWNGMMISALAQAGKQFSDKKYLNIAISVADFLWQVHHINNPSISNSQLWRASLNGQPSVMATLADYAYLAKSYLDLFDITKEQKWLQRSQKLSAEMVAFFWDTEQGAFYMNAKGSPTHSNHLLFNRPKDIYDGAIPSANAVALEVLIQLYHRTGEDNYYAKAIALIASLSAKVSASPTAFSYFLMAVNQLHFGEITAVQYGGKGHLRLEMITTKSNLSAEIQLTLDKNWHINSHYPNDNDLIATSLSIADRAKNSWKIVQAEYPSGSLLKVAFNEQPLSLYQHSITLKLIVEAIKEQKTTITIPIQLDYQVCNNKICLAPESTIFYLFPQKNSLK
jgi:uncharacterized protein YyaL (SSP411 family)